MTTFIFNDENKQKIIKVDEHLLGTCQSVEEGLATEFGEEVDLMQFDTELLRELDDITLLCDSCGWWVETGFTDDEGNCDDCQQHD